MGGLRDREAYKADIGNNFTKLTAHTKTRTEVIDSAKSKLTVGLPGGAERAASSTDAAEQGLDRVEVSKTLVKRNKFGLCSVMFVVVLRGHQLP